MISISKNEAKVLAGLGVKYGENGISHTYTKNKHYYLCANRKNLGMLKKLRTSNITEVHNNKNK